MSDSNLEPRKPLWTQADTNYVGKRMVFGAASLGLGAVLTIVGRRVNGVGEALEGVDQALAGVLKKFIRPFVRGEGVTEDSRNERAERYAANIASEFVNNGIEFAGGLTALVGAMALLKMPMGYRPER